MPTSEATYVLSDNGRDYGLTVEGSRDQIAAFEAWLDDVEPVDEANVPCDCEECRPTPPTIDREEYRLPDLTVTHVNIDSPARFPVSYYVGEDLAYILREKDPTGANAAPSIRIVNNECADYASVLRQTFAFFRTHGDRRYSDHTLMRLARAADAVDYGESGGSRHWPEVIVTSVPFEFNEETETKTGGVLAMLVHLGDGRCILAVNRTSRRRRLGAMMMRLVPYVTPTPVFWVHQQNTTAQSFLLSAEYFPSAINSQGAIRYAGTVEQDD